MLWGLGTASGPRLTDAPPGPPHKQATRTVRKPLLKDTKIQIPSPALAVGDMRTRVSQPRLELPANVLPEARVSPPTPLPGPWDVAPSPRPRGQPSVLILQASSCPRAMVKSPLPAPERPKASSFLGSLPRPRPVASRLFFSGHALGSREKPFVTLPVF